MPIYKCFGCNYTTKMFSDLKRHMERKKDECYRDNSKNKYSADERIVLSLYPENTLVDEDISKFKKTDNLYRRNLLKLFQKMNGNYINNKYCVDCDINFSKICDFKNHIIMDCFYKSICNTNNILIEDKKVNINSNNITNNNNCNNTNCNNTNCNNTTNNINTININNNIEFKLIPFDEKWDISDITDSDYKFKLLCSEIMYSKLLIKILEKKQNLNIVYTNKSDTGYVYKNEDEKYVAMKLKDIVDKSMVKLYDHFMEINQNVSNILIADNIIDTKSDLKKDTILKKINEYNNDEFTNKNVINLMGSIFDKKYNDSTEISKNIDNNNILSLKNEYNF